MVVEVIAHPGAHRVTGLVVVLFVAAAAEGLIGDLFSEHTDDATATATTATAVKRPVLRRILPSSSAGTTMTRTPAGAQAAQTRAGGAYGDNAYDTGYFHDQLGRAGVDDKCKTPQPVAAGGRAKDRFDIDLDARQLTCPAGCTALIERTRTGLVPHASANCAPAARRVSSAQPPEPTAPAAPAYPEAAVRYQPPRGRRASCCLSSWRVVVPQVL